MNLSLEVNNMEQVTAAVNDELVQSLDYKLQSSNVNYVQSRADVVYYPSSLSVFTPTTSRVCRIPLTSGQSFVDGESVKLGFTVHNNSDTATLQLASPDPSCLIDRIEAHRRLFDPHGRHAGHLPQLGALHGFRHQGRQRHRLEPRVPGAHRRQRGRAGAGGPAGRVHRQQRGRDGGGAEPRGRG